MTISELQSALYMNIVTKLLRVVDEFGDATEHREDEINGARFFRGYERRPTQFRHNYQRDKFLQQRDQYMYGQVDRLRFHILTEHNKNEIVIFRKPMGYIFGADTDKAVNLLHKMLSRMYDKVEIADASGVEVFDATNGRGENRESFHAVR